MISWPDNCDIKLVVQVGKGWTVHGRVVANFYGDRLQGIGAIFCGRATVGRRAAEKMGLLRERLGFRRCSASFLSSSRSRMDTNLRGLRSKKERKRQIT